MVMLVGMPLEVFLGLAILNLRSSIAPEHTLSDTHAGGAVFWAASIIITFAGALVMLEQWMSKDKRTARPRDSKPRVREARQLQMWKTASMGNEPPLTVSTPTERHRKVGGES
jgi:cytochrome c oxidase assembly factor CtaG